MTPPRVRSIEQVGFVGRERELAELRTALDGVARGEGRVWLIGGEPGIGKTRMLEALAEAAGTTEIRVLWGRCWEGGGAPAYWPWVQVLRTATSGASAEALLARAGAVAADLTAILPELAGRVPGVTATSFPEAPDARFRLFDGITGFLTAAATEAPLLVALDDLHAADEASLLLLEFVAAAVARVPVAVVGTYRDAEVAASPRLSELLSGVARHGDRLMLSGLSPADVETVFAAAFEAPVGAEQVARVHEVTDGNPFLVKEMARLLAARRPRPRPGDRLPLPDQAHAIVSRRLAPVAGSLRRILAAASVLGRDFDLGSLAALTGEPPGVLLDSLGDGRRQGVLEEVGAGRWSFAHALLREVLYDELTLSSRAALHRQAADMLEARTTRDWGTHLAAVAHHRYAAAGADGNPSAVEACAAAGAQAIASLAFEDAAGWYGRALDVLGLPGAADQRRRYDLLMALGQARFRAFQFAEARDAYGAALDVARSLGSAELFAEAALGVFGNRRLDRSSVTCLEEALEDVALVDGSLRARLLVSVGAALLATRPDGWRRWAAMCEDGLAMARRVGDPATRLAALVLWHRCHMDWNPLAVEERLAAADEALKLSDEGDRGGEATSAALRLWRFCDLLEMGNVTAARAEAGHASLEAERLRLPLLIELATSMEAVLALLEGKVDTAHDLGRKAEAAGRHGSESESAQRFGRFAAILHRQKGEHDEARKMLASVRPTASISGGAFWHLAVRTDAALVAVELGAPDARQDLEAVVSDALSVEGPPLAPEVLVELGEACWHLDAGDHAARLYELLLPYQGRLVIVQIMAAPLGAADRHLGQLAALLGGYDEAEGHFEAAHTLHRRWGALGYLAHGQADHARMLLTRDRRGDRTRAAELAAEASRGYRALGLAYHEERVSRLVGLAGTEPTATPAPIAAGPNILRLEGEYWYVAYGGRDVRLRDSKGLRYLALLLRAPGREFHVLDLVGSGSELERAGVGGDAGPLLDPAAKAAYRRRLVELAIEADEADAAHDVGRSERVAAERDFLVAELAAAVGLGGRDRVTATAAERARQSVTKSVRNSIARIGDVHPILGRHLATTVRTGLYCAYRPDERLAIAWEP